MGELLELPDVGPAVWEAFQSGGSGLDHGDLLACWTRAQALGASPAGAPAEDHLLRGDALRLHAGHVELVAAIGDAVLDRATARVADRDFVLLLADADGVVVNTRGGGTFEASAKQLRLIEGASWSERDRGTNAIGTAATENRAIAVHGHAHFGQRYRDLVCYAAPIRGIDGAPIAVLDATAVLASANPDVGRVITRAAAALEELLRLQAYATAGVSITRVLGRSVERMRDPAFIVESPGRILRANPAALAALGSELAGRDPAQVLGLAWPELVLEALAPAVGGRRLELGRGDRKRAFRARVEPIAAPSGAVLAVVVELEPDRSPALPAVARTASRPLKTDPFAPIFAEDATVDAAIAWSRRLATSELPVMLLAETGSGKELFASAIHAASARAAGPFLAINCGALAPSLLETELFGYASGAFTGAERGGRPGLFQAARGGTLFLDEVAEMSAAMQAALLRVLETNTVRRVGETRLERTDVRVLCATCRDLGALTASGAFRQDLYYRLKGATVKIPALRERTDVIALAQHLVGATALLAPDTAAAIARYAWPGNVRELKSALAVAQLQADGATWLELAHLPPEVAAEAPVPVATGELESVERAALQRALSEAAGNLAAAARKLGVARSTLYRMLKKHGLAQS